MKINHIYINNSFILIYAFLYYRNINSYKNTYKVKSLKIQCFTITCNASDIFITNSVQIM